jgi:UDP-glucose 4-epimerase
VNSTGTLKLLTAARDNGVKKLVFSSSTAVYGESGKLPLTEDAPLQPRSPYAASKIASEYFCQVFSEIYDLSTISLRYFNVYGPRQDPNSQYAAAVPKFMEAFLKGNNPVIYGDGEQTRDFIYVKDVVKANIHFCESSYTGQYQIASGKSISINQLCDILQELFQTQTTPLYKDCRPGDIKHSVADTSKALEAGYKSETDFMTGLKETIDSLNL